MNDIPRIGPTSDSFDGPPEDETGALLRGALLREADRVTPSRDGLQRIQREIRAGQAHRPGPWLGRLAPALVAAAAVAVLAVAGTVAVRISQQPAGGSGPAGQPSPTASASTTVPPTSEAPWHNVPVYVIGTQGDRAWLFREYRNSSAATLDGRVADAVTAAVNETPQDPDYDPPVFQGGRNGRVSAHVTDSLITVTLTAAMVSRTDVTDAQARMALQQLVWTATAAAGTGRAETPVQFVVDSGSQMLFGRIDLQKAYARVDFTPNPRAPLWLSSLAEGTDVGHGKVTVSGDAVVGKDGWVTWTLVRDGVPAGGDRATLDKPAGTQTMPSGAVGVRREWSFVLPGSGVPGHYRLTVTLHPGSDTGLSPDATWQDTRDFVIR